MVIGRILLLLGLLCVLAEGQTRGVLPNEPANSATWKPKRRIVVTIGIDQYANWTKLDNAVSDAREVAAVLQSAGFVTVVPPLFNKDASKKAILRLIETQLPDKLEEDDDLILFFAGHGTSKEKKVGKDVFSAGYIVPVEASAPEDNEWSDYISLGELLESVGTLPARHVLLILDSCRSGVALGRVVEMSRGDPGDAAAARVSRTIITSAAANQDASDSGPRPGHSLFAGILLTGLESGDADLDRDGVISDAELALYLKAQLKKAKGSKQSPAFGQFLADNRGEMAFPRPDPKLLAELRAPKVPVDTPPPASQRPRPKPAPSVLVGGMVGAVGRSTRGPKRAVRQAIVIGCDNYRTLGNLRYAVADARGVGQAFESLGYQVSYAINPTTAELRQLLSKAAAAASSNLGSLAVFIAGIGFTGANGERYFALTDSDPQDLETTSISYEEVQRRLESSGAKERLFFIDAMFGRSRSSRGPANDSWAPSSGFGTLEAGGAREAVIEDEKLGHGVFSYFLIRGLRGAAAGPDGAITFDGLVDHVRAQVRAWTSNRQHPREYGDIDPTFPIGVVRQSDKASIPDVPEAPRRH